MNLENLEKQVSLLENYDFESLESISEDNISEVVVQMVDEDVQPDDEKTKKVVGFSRLIRNFGLRLLNLFTLTITCSFSGTTLFVWQSPKFDKDGNKIVNNK